MVIHSGSIGHLFLLVLALVLFFLGALPAYPSWPYRLQLLCAGAFCVTLSLFV